MKKIIVTVLTFLILSCAQERISPSAENIKLERVWASDSLLQTPESVIYDKARNVLYVSNINSNPWLKDGNGFISKMDLNGNIIDLKWVEGMNGPKGMGIVDSKLFVTDMNEIVEIDIESAEIISKYAHENEDAKLNDISTSKKGEIYVSSSELGTYFHFQNGEFITVVEGDTGRSNGVYVEENRLLMLGFNSQLLRELDFATNEITVLADSLGKADGIVPAGKGDYITSGWAGQLFYVASDYSTSKLIDTRDQNIGAADIEYIIHKNLLLVPTFYDNRVIAYKIVK